MGRWFSSPGRAGAPCTKAPPINSPCRSGQGFDSTPWPFAACHPLSLHNFLSIFSCTLINTQKAKKNYSFMFSYEDYLISSYDCVFHRAYFLQWSKIQCKVPMAFCRGNQDDDNFLVPNKRHPCGSLFPVQVYVKVFYNYNAVSSMTCCTTNRRLIPAVHIPWVYWATLSNV